MRLNRDFYERDTLLVAKELVGCMLVRRRPDGELASVLITETEAYKGEDDPASHAHRGVTPRNRLMFGPPGILYVYFSYGMHHCMNLVTETDGVSGAVLLRAALPVAGEDWIACNRPGVAKPRWMDGPGKLTKALAVDLGHNGLDLCQSDQHELWVELGEPLPTAATPRIGITKAVEYPWRFIAVTK